MRLRPAKPNDVETLFAIRSYVRQNYKSKEELENLGITIESVKEMIEGGDYITILAEADDQAVGFSMAQISEAYVFACFVRPEFESRGTGRALMDSTEAELRSRGVERAWLSTGAEAGLRAPGFYLHLGWYKDGYLEDGQIIFRKRLINTEQDVS